MKYFALRCMYVITLTDLLDPSLNDHFTPKE